jgi:hypothetical protein
LIELIESSAGLALDCIGNSDALYHNVEHTMLVTLVGYDIMKGRSLLVSTSASEQRWQQVKSTHPSKRLLNRRLSRLL